jgi:hypothetical protein
LLDFKQKKKTTTKGKEQREKLNKGYRRKVAPCREISECRKTGALLKTDLLRFREIVPGELSLF